MRHLSICLSIAAALIPHCTATSSTRASPPLAARSTAASTTIVTGAENTACADVAAASASYASAYPSTDVYVNASLAVECLNSIPIVADDALQLMYSLRAYLEFQSDKEYLRSPPPGYLNPSHDLDVAINNIINNIESNWYDNENEFQLDIFYALAQAYDGHLYWSGDISTGIFSFSLNFRGLASVSSDGIADPELYFVEDIIMYDSEATTVVPSTGGYTRSPVVKLNGVDIVSALDSLGEYTYTQDPDARYNTQLYSLGNTGNIFGSLSTLSVPPEQDYWVFEFANGSSTQVPIYARLLKSFDNVTDGLNAYNKFAPFANLWNITEDSSEDVTSLSDRSVATIDEPSSDLATRDNADLTVGYDRVPFFPYPVIKDTVNLIAGYYLDDPTYADVAVLQITGFMTNDPNAPSDYLFQFQNVLRDFLGNATADGKTKLIIDVQANGGGVVDLATDTFVQLFPNIFPNRKTNMRRSQGLDVAVRVASDEVTALGPDATAEDIEAVANSPFAVQYDVDPDNQNITSIEDLLNGITFGDANFTAFFQTNYSDPLASESTGFEITQANLNAIPPFAPDNVILLTDGICASSCTTLAEHLKNQAGVQVMMVGGRPSHGPVQAIGGIKGTQVFNAYTFQTLLNSVKNATADELAAMQFTDWEYFTNLPLARTGAAVRSGNAWAGSLGVNGRNAFRIGDDTDTPLQYVYEAADCRIWFTPEMMTNPNTLWKRVADVAFTDRDGLAFTSPYCVEGSTGHPTSISGGWEQGTLGPQDVVAANTAVTSVADSDESGAATHPLAKNFDWSKIVDIQTFADKCLDYEGDKWLVMLMCRAYRASTP